MTEAGLGLNTWTLQSIYFVRKSGVFHENLSRISVIYSGDHKFDQELADSLQGAEFNVTESKLDKAGFSIMPKLKEIADKEVPGFDVVHLHVFRTFQN